MIISYSHNFVIPHLEKTGGTTVTHSIQPYLKPCDFVINDWTKLKFNQEGDVLSEHTPTGIIAKYLGQERWAACKKFAVVRDPVQIMKSFYSYSSDVYDEFFKGTEDVPLEGGLKALVYSNKTGYGPDGFVDFMFSRGYISVAPQAERLHYMLEDGLIVDISTLDVEWDDAMSYLGLGKIPLLHKNVSKHPKPEFSDSTIKKIKKNFEKDYDVLPNITGVVWDQCPST